MGLIIFVIASGLTLVFGLMDVLNFGHGVFIALGAFMATTVMAAMTPWAGESGALQLASACSAPCWWPWRWPARWAGPSSG
jgi:branched-chain amino acid transport system permease protein